MFAYRRHEFYFEPGLSRAIRKRLDEEINSWNSALLASPVKEVVVHSRSVAALAADNAQLRKRSFDRLKQELELARMLRAAYYVFHLGPYGERMDLQTGLRLVQEGLSGILQDTPAQGPAIILENVPGGARRMGGTLEELASMVAALSPHGPRFGLCLDVAHCWGAGYSLKNAGEARKFFADFSKLVPSSKLAMIHWNNSSLPLGCHLDQHAHLAQGHVPPEVYRVILKEWPAKVGILETPKEPLGSDRVNVDFLRNL